MGTLRQMINSYLTSEEREAVENALTQLETALKKKMYNLSAEERRKYGSISEQNKLFVNKVNDFSNFEPNLKSPDVDWEKFKRDFSSRNFLEQVINRMEKVVDGIVNAKTLHDHDNYQSALDDYNYTHYKTTTSTSGYERKYEELRQFFVQNR